MADLPKRSILSPVIPGSRTPEEFREAWELVLGGYAAKKAAAKPAEKPAEKAAAKKPAAKKTAAKKPSPKKSL